MRAGRPPKDESERKVGRTVSLLPEKWREVDEYAWGQRPPVPPLALAAKLIEQGLERIKAGEAKHDARQLDITKDAPKAKGTKGANGTKRGRK